MLYNRNTDLQNLWYNNVMQPMRNKSSLDRQVNIRLNESLYGEVYNIANDITSSVSQIIREALLEYLKNRAQRPKT
jgi:hypothetical protein